uniref:WW domain binding protein VOPP1 n=1 Tax=Prolemur simus TaxID=1328070 RepID=A0A8C9AS40_PROSS
MTQLESTHLPTARGTDIRPTHACNWASNTPGSGVALLLGLLCNAQKPFHCWYFEGLKLTYYMCCSYEDCSGCRCWVWALSLQRLWYLGFLLMISELFCCRTCFSFWSPTLMRPTPDSPPNPNSLQEFPTLPCSLTSLLSSLS